MKRWMNETELEGKWHVKYGSTVRVEISRIKHLRVTVKLENIREYCLRANFVLINLISMMKWKFYKKL